MSTAVRLSDATIATDDEYRLNVHTAR